jgi:hypothetical protein
LESSTDPERRYECELRLEELCEQWEQVGIDTTSIHRGIGEFRDPIGTAEHLVLTGAPASTPREGGSA